MKDKLVLKAEMLDLQNSMVNTLEVQKQITTDITKLNSASITNEIRMQQLIEDNAELKEANKDLNRDIKAILRGIAQIQRSTNP